MSTCSDGGAAVSVTAEMLSQASFVPGSGQPGSSLILLHDGHGSTRILTTSTGAIATAAGVRQIYTYDAYGNAIGFNPAAAMTRFQYSGEQFDPATGFQRLGSRYYDLATGRFTQYDTYAGDPSDPQSLDKMLYTQGDPINATDPTGHDATFAIYGTALAVLGLVSPVAFGAVMGVRAAVKGANNWGIARDALVATALAELPGPGLKIALVGGALGVAFGAAAGGIVGFPGVGGIVGGIMGGLPGGLLFAGALANTVGEAIGAAQKDFANGIGGFDATALMLKFRAEFRAKYANLAPADVQSLPWVLLNPLNAIGGWDMRQMNSTNKNSWTANVVAPPGRDVLPNTLTYQDRVFAVAEVNYTLWGMVNRAANDQKIAPAVTNYWSMLSIALFYRSTAGGLVNLAAWFFGGGLADTRYETTTGKMAFVDHGWDLEANPAATPPVEASLGMGDNNVVVPNNNPYQLNALGFSAGPDATKPNGFILFRP